MKNDLAASSFLLLYASQNQEMKVIADSGSSKTDWFLIDGNRTLERFETKGFNPYFHTTDSIVSEIGDTFQSLTLEEVKEVHFYGAGCSSKERMDLVKEALESVFDGVKIFVSHDLLGSARAACGKQKGLAGILGTGSNCCSFDGVEIIDSFPSGGYSIGDEGGGVNLGRRMLKAYIEDYLPEDLRIAFDRKYATNVDEILVNLYKKPFPNRYMASFSRFTYHHREHPFVSEQILEEFTAYFSNQVMRFKQAQEWPLSLVGSVAFYYHEYIRIVAEQFGVQIGTILEKPISGLCLYHQED
tara:strand:- start:2606 stop:3505 length:900 start_codon:yes stop_codon:yes gene_type:complete